MLTTLRQIVQEVNSAQDFKEAMQVLVSRVREAIETQACSIFLVDNKRKQFVLMATDGLNEKAVGKTRLNFNEGLTGLVGQKKEPVNISDAPSHPNYYLSPKIGDERFKSFLGVPIIHQRHLVGVLIVQQEEERGFDESEEAFLVTMSAQMAGLIAHANATGTLAKLWEYKASKKTRSETSTLKGIPAVPGVGIGVALVVYPLADLDAVPDKEASDIDAEIILFEQALEKARQEIKELIIHLPKDLPTAEKALFDVYLQILDDNSIGKEVIHLIQSGQWAQGALRQIIKQHIRSFEAMEDAYLRERADDLRDLGRRVLSHLQSNKHTTNNYPEKTVLVGEEVTASALAAVPEGQLVGIISTQGSKNSHVAILSRALGVPAVMGTKGLNVAEIDGHELIVDGYYGQVYIDPNHRLRKQYQALAKEEQQLDADLDKLRDLPAQTPDKHQVSLFINTGLNEDAGLSSSVGAEGIGLFRTEVPFMIRDAFPTEEEQRILYRQLLNAFHPRPVIMRTLDVGGDKPLPYFPVEESNPFLGWRGLRITLDHPEVFLVQLRAMLKANAGMNNLRIMFPMVTYPGEVDDALRLLAKAHKEIIEEGNDIPMPPVGVMLEVPSAVYQAGSIAKRVDFMSVGSNDLTQYLLAVDRNNAHVSNLYDALHPAVLMALMQSVQSAHNEGKQISICGEMAGDPAAVILLIAMGFDALSMNATALPRIKWVIRNIPRSQAKEFLKQALSVEDPVVIRFHLEQALEKFGLGGLVRAGK